MWHRTQELLSELHSFEINSDTQIVQPVISGWLTLAILDQAAFCSKILYFYKSGVLVLEVTKITSQCGTGSKGGVVLLLGTLVIPEKP